MLYYLKKTWLDSSLTILCQIISSGVAVFAALASMKALDGLLEQNAALFFWSLAAHLSAWAISFTASHLETVFHYRALRKINGFVRRDMTAALIKKNREEYCTRENGAYLSAFTNDITQMEQLGWEPFFNLFGTISRIVSSLIALAVLHWSLMALSLVLGAVMILLPKIFDKKLNNAGENCSRQQARAVSAFKDLLMGYDVLQSFGKTKDLYNRTSHANEQMENPRYRLKVLRSIAGNSMGFISVVFQVLVRLLAGVLILTGSLSISVMVSVSTICSDVYNGLKELVNLQLSFSAGKPYFRHLTVHAEDSVLTEENENTMAPFCHSIQVEGLSFQYDRKPILKDVSFTFEKGRKYALTGPSGCGKSTLLKLLLGWLPNYSGNIYFDRQDIRTMTAKSLAQQISYIEQNVFLFHTTIRENITLGDSFTEEQINEAVKKSALLNDLSSMPEGLDTVVDEEGRNLSGGQKQRIAIARALIHSRSILLVDEGTSALDAKNADLVEQSLLANQDLTLILISHHLSPERRQQFDKVYVMNPYSTQNTGV